MSEIGLGQISYFYQTLNFVAALSLNTDVTSLQVTASTHRQSAKAGSGQMQSIQYSHTLIGWFTMVRLISDTTTTQIRSHQKHELSFTHDGFPLTS